MELSSPRSELAAEIKAALAQQEDALASAGISPDIRRQVLAPLEQLSTELQQGEAAVTTPGQTLSFQSERHNPEIVARFGRLEAKRFICCLDLELTCWAADDPAKRPQEEMEIIEIGIAVLDCEHGGKSVNRTAVFARPVWHPRLSAYCGDLTGIKQAQVDQAEPLPETINRLQQQLPPAAEFVWASWGNDPLHLENEYARKAPGSAPLFDPRFINAAVPVRAHLGRKTGGMREALAKLGLEQEQPAHRALPDALSVERLIQQFCFTPLDALVSSSRSYRERMQQIQRDLTAKFSRRCQLDPDFTRDLLQILRWDAVKAQQVLKLFKPSG